MVDENETFTLKTKINTLGNVLKKCKFDKTKLKAMFSKKKSSKKHIHTTYAPTSKSHTKHAHILHAYHTHHAFVCGRVYSCTYCGQKGHLAKFCFDRINASNNYVWVRSTNVTGPKKIWVLKSTTQLFDISTHQDSKM